MKIIFLDMDGVLNTSAPGNRDYLQPWPFAISPSLVARLNELVKATGAKLVWSSTWRKYRTTEWAEGFLHAHGLEPLESLGTARHFLGKTPSLTRELRRAVMRGEEITAWLEVNPQVESYVIIDDAREAGVGHPRERFVQTYHGVGLSDVDVGLAREALNTPILKEAA